MNVNVLDTSQELGKKAAQQAAQVINEAIQKNGSARIILSTGASQFDVLDNLIKSDIDWSKVEMFHLDEYVGLPESHKASFRKYLKERFVSQLPAELKAAHFVDGEGDIQQNIAQLTEEIRKSPVDLGLIGIGENAHIAFNDPPADFDTKDAYIVVNLDDACKNQQVGEGWFENIDQVPQQAITMSVHQILQCKTIISCVPYKVKSKAIKNFFESDVTNLIPATILKTHDDYTLYLDKDSASEADPKYLS